jgi:hypothetical protein
VNAERERFEALASEAMAHLAKALQGQPGTREEELALAADCTARASAYAGALRIVEAR